MENDTGWLSVEDPDIFNGTVNYRRIGKIVCVRASGITLKSDLSASNTRNANYLIPSGFRPNGPFQLGARFNAYKAGAGVAINGSGTLTFINATGETVLTSTSWSFSGTYIVG